MTKLAPLALALLSASGAALSAGASLAAEPMKMDHGALVPRPVPPPAGAAPSGAAAPAAATASDKAFTASSDAMMKGMDVKPSGNPDRDFVAMMLPHHQGAVDMAKIEIQYGRDPELRKLAADIIRAQAIEIAQMQAWQKKAK